MNLTRHVRNTFLAGLFAFVPLAGLAYVAWLVESNTYLITQQLFGFYIPAVGVLFALVVVYILGLITRSIVGQFCLKLLDQAISAVPVLKDLYGAWKKISLTPDEDSIFSRVVLVPGPHEGQAQVGFYCGHGIPDDPEIACIFIPGAPNPINGKMIFLPVSECRILAMDSEDAFKLLLSGGNFVPEQIGALTSGNALPTETVSADSKDASKE